MDSLKSIIPGLAGGLFAFWLLRTRGRLATRLQGRSSLQYAPGFRGLAGLLLAAPLVILAAFWHAPPRPEETVPAIALAVLFGGAPIYLAYEVFLVDRGFDWPGVHHASPLRGSRTIPWRTIRRAGYSRLAQSYFIRTDRGRVWLSEHPVGLEELMDQIDIRRIPRPCCGGGWSRARRASRARSEFDREQGQGRSVRR